MSPLEELRHSASHVLATAVLRLFPEAKLDIGPPTDAGFYYDIDLEHKFTADDLVKIEAEMKKRGLMEQEIMMGESNPFVEMVSKLRFSVEQTQVYHWQSQSYSEHIALNEYYDGIPLIVDGIVESYQGKYGIQKGYRLFEVRDYSTPEEVINFLKQLGE